MITLVKRPYGDSYKVFVDGKIEGLLWRVGDKWHTNTLETEFELKRFMFSTKTAAIDAICNALEDKKCDGDEIPGGEA